MPGRGQNRTAAFPQHAGWWRDGINNRLVAVFGGTEIFDFDGNDLAFATGVSVALVGTGSMSSATAFTSTVVGNAFIGATGNVAIGNPSVFATTQPQGAVHMGGTSKSGIAPVGATVTSGAVFASDTVVRKIIADGTASNVET